MFWKKFTHSIQVFSQQLFVGQFLNVGQVIGPLIPLHLVQELRQDVTIDPPDVPVLFFVLAESEVGLLSSVL